MRSRSVDPEACWPCVVEETESDVIVRVESAFTPRLSFQHESSGFSLRFRPWEFLDLTQHLCTLSDIFFKPMVRNSGDSKASL